MSSQDLHITRLDVSQPTPPVTSGHLALGGQNSQGSSIEFNSYYMLQDGKPCIPVMGEFHFSRYAHDLWDDEILKIKAGGVNILATYVFWNHVEEEEGVFDWTGNNDLRHFVELCDQHGLQVIVRIGPFAHGECRNGGIPDWMYGRPFELRSNDERYLAYARRLYAEIAKQIEGLLFKDGGAVIGIQLENEYMHAGAPWEVTFRPGTEWVWRGSEGVSHIAQLKRLALDVGLDVPIYSCTGWLNSPILEGEILPMQGGYAFTPWSPDPAYRQPPTREFLFRNRHLAPVLNGEPTYNPSKYPLACCEIGGGIQDTYYHRNIVPPQSVEALALVNLGGGANLIGYYMYHGGSHPVGKHSFMNEFTVPRISYDFQAPIREFGQIGASFRSLRLLHLFLKDFGDLLAPMTVTLPANASAITPENASDVRCVVRSKDGAGFLFLNSYQDHVEMLDLDNLRFELQTADGIIALPQSGALSLPSETSAILPFGLTLDGVMVEYATAQLLTKINDGDETSYFFFAPRGIASEYAFAADSYRALSFVNGEINQADGRAIVSVTPGIESIITLHTHDTQAFRVFTLTREQAEHASKLRLWGAERLVISEATLAPLDDNCVLFNAGDEPISLLIYPPIDGNLTTTVGEVRMEEAQGMFMRCSIHPPRKDIALNVDHISAGKATVTLPADILDGVNNVWLQVDYVGDIGSAYLDGKLVSDNFYNGTRWEIGIRQIIEGRGERELVLLITPAREETGGRRFLPTGMAFSPDAAADDGLAVIRAVNAIVEHKITLRQA